MLIPQIFDKNTLVKFSKQAQKVRKSLVKPRKEFWANNKQNFGKNVGRLIRSANLPADWKIYRTGKYMF
jgi:hypothetical protein